MDWEKIDKYLIAGLGILSLFTIIPELKNLKKDKSQVTTI